jgi:hypothetical protein
LTASPSDRLSAWTGEAVNVDQPHQAGVGPEVELDVAVPHDGRWTSSFHGVRVYVLRLAEGVPKRVTIGTDRDQSETPAAKEISQGYDRHVRLVATERMFGLSGCSLLRRDCGTIGYPALQAADL